MTMNEIEKIQQKIYEVNGKKVMFDDDLASLYEIETSAASLMILCLK